MRCIGQVLECIKDKKTIQGDYHLIKLTDSSLQLYVNVWMSDFPTNLKQVWEYDLAIGKRRHLIGVSIIVNCRN